MLKCNEIKRNAVPHLQNIAQRVSSTSDVLKMQGNGNAKKRLQLSTLLINKRVHFVVQNHFFSDQLSLAIPQWVGGMSTGDGLLATTREETVRTA